MLVKIAVSFPISLCVMVHEADNSVSLLLFLPFAHGKRLCIFFLFLNYIYCIISHHVSVPLYPVLPWAPYFIHCMDLLFWISVAEGERAEWMRQDCMKKACGHTKWFWNCVLEHWPVCLGKFWELVNLPTCMSNAVGCKILLCLCIILWQIIIKFYIPHMLYIVHTVSPSSSERTVHNYKV